MKLERARNIADLRKLAQRRLPRMVFDYIDGAADDEVTLQRNVSRFRDYQLAPDILVDVAEIDTSTTILGQPSKLPFFISPTAASRLFHPRDGERAVARAAEKAGTIYACSTIASTTIEEIGASIKTPRWFQLYVWRDRGLLKETLARVREAGFSAIILTADMPVAGNRERDPANEFTIPPKVTLSTVSQVLSRPGYLWDLATTPPIGPANFTDKAKGEGLVEMVNAQFDRTVSWRDADWLREQWGGKFAIKGVMTPADGRRAAEIGANAVWVSNHGGRQLDTAMSTIDALPGIVEAVRGDAEIIFDGGIRRGTDIIKALALGANGVALGRAYLWGLAAGGEQGVSHALSLLEAELRRDMALLGRLRIADLKPDLIARRPAP